MTGAAKSLYPRPELRGFTLPRINLYLGLGVRAFDRTEQSGQDQAGHAGIEQGGKLSRHIASLDNRATII